MNGCGGSGTCKRMNIKNYWFDGMVISITFKLRLAAVAACVNDTMGWYWVVGGDSSQQMLNSKSHFSFCYNEHGW
jgi:hypothetical protein